MPSLIATTTQNTLSIVVVEACSIGCAGGTVVAALVGNMGGAAVKAPTFCACDATLEALICHADGAAEGVLVGGTGGHLAEASMGCACGAVSAAVIGRTGGAVSESIDYVAAASSLGTRLFILQQ